MPIGVYPRKPNRKLDLEFHCWRGMIERCTSPSHASYKDYGGRGIKVCERWLHYPYFKEDMGSRPSRTHQLDRIDCNGNYTPENCRWATPLQQARNARSNVTVVMNGKRYCITELAELTGIRPPTLYSRMARGVSFEELLSPPKHMLTLNGITKTWSDWSRLLGIPYNTILKRVKEGKPVDVILENGVARNQEVS